MVDSAGDAAFSIDGLDSFRALLLEAPERMGEALYRGTRRSLGAFRRDFLAQVPAAIRGRGNAGPNQAAARRPRTIGRGFRYEVHPLDEEQVRGAGTEIDGSIFTESKAAHGLEVPGRVRPKQGLNLAIPISVPGAPNAAARGGVKPSWKYLGKVYRTKRNQFAFFFINRPGGGVTVMAQARTRRPRGRPADDAPAVPKPKAFPIFYLKPEIVNEGNRLRFFQTWEGYQGEIGRRFEAELDRELAELARERGGSGR